MPWFVIDAPNGEQAQRLSKNLQNAGTRVHFQDGRYEVFVGKRHVSGLTKKSLEFGGTLIPREVFRSRANGSTVRTVLRCTECGKDFETEESRAAHLLAVHKLGKFRELGVLEKPAAERISLLCFRSSSPSVAGGYRKWLNGKGYRVYVLSHADTGVDAPLSAGATLAAPASKLVREEEHQKSEFQLHKLCGYWVLGEKFSKHIVRCGHRKERSLPPVERVEFLRAEKSPGPVFASKSDRPHVTIADAVEAFGYALTVLGKALRKEA